MSKLKSLLQRPLRVLLLVFLLLEFFPVFGKDAAALRLYESHNFRGDYTTYYVLQPDGDLISWGKGPLDHNRSNDFFGIYPYFLRRKIARSVIAFACTPNVILYVDENHVLWGSGTDKKILHSEAEGRVRIMEDVEQVAANYNYAVALKTDGSVWVWSGQYHREYGTERPSSAPVNVAEKMRAVFYVGDLFSTGNCFFGLTNENTLVQLNLSGGKPVVIARDVKEVSCFYPGHTVYQYLTQQGEVYTFGTRFPSKIAENVDFLFEKGLVKKDHSMWEWEGTYPDGKLVKIKNGVQSASSNSFYLDIAGRLHWVTSDIRLPVPSRSIRSLKPLFRSAFLLALLFCLLYEKRRKNAV